MDLHLLIQMEVISVWVILQAAKRKVKIISTATCSLKFKQFTASLFSKCETNYERGTRCGLSGEGRGQTCKFGSLGVTVEFSSFSNKPFSIP